MLAPWQTMTPSAPFSGTTISAVTEWDLFLRFRTQFSRQASHAADEELGLTLDEHRPAGEVRVELFKQPVVQGQHLVARRLDQPLPLQLVELLRHLLGEIVRLAPVLVRVELPHIVVEWGSSGR